MKKLKTLLLLSVLSLPSFAECLLDMKASSPEISFKAFKTYGKVGVPGSFTKVKWTGATKAPSLGEILKGQNFEIDTTSVSTKNPARDKKIVDNFFNNLSGKNVITGTVTKVSKSQVFVNLTLNGIQKLIPLNYSFVNSRFTANGDIDVLDFSASKALKAINKACYALHEGKTWSHVEISVSYDLPNCKP